MRNSITIVILLIIWINIKGEIIQPKENAIMEVCYSKIVNRDTTRNDYIIDSPMILRIGEKGSMFFPQKSMANDSLNYYNRELGIQVVIDALTKGHAVSYVLGHEHEYIFRNLNENETMVYQAVGSEAAYYIEPTECPIWTIGDSLRNISGRECIDAHCSFRGREWTAWFTPEIPIKEGPWKLFGLPGLVVEAYDNQQHYRFELTSIRIDNLSPVGIFIYDRLYAEKLRSRKEYLCRMYSLLLKGDFMKSVASITGKSVSRNKIKPYDFEETDYPHE